MKDQIENMLTNLFTGNTHEAEKSFTQIISQKAASQIDAMRPAVIQQTFNKTNGQ